MTVREMALWLVSHELIPIEVVYKDKIPAASGATVDQVLHGGEEYELLVTASANIPLIEIGEIIPSADENQILLVDGSSESVLAPKGWQHF